MAGYYCPLLFLGILVFCSFETGTSLKCYSCSSIVSSFCGDPVNVTLLDTVFCNERNYGCMKQKLSDSEKTSYRGCTPVAFCETPKSDVSSCSVCTTDLCNLSSIAMPSIVIIALAFIAIRIPYKL